MGSEGELKRGEAFLIKLLPPPFIREGDKGGGLPNKNLKGGGLANNFKIRRFNETIIR